MFHDHVWPGCSCLDSLVQPTSYISARSLVALIGEVHVVLLTWLCPSGTLCTSPAVAGDVPAKHLPFQTIWTMNKIGFWNMLQQFFISLWNKNKWFGKFGLRKPFTQHISDPLYRRIMIWWAFPKKKIWKKQKERLQSKKLYHSGIMVLPNTGWTWKTPVTGGCNIVGIQFFPRPWTSWRSCTRTEVPIQRLNRWGPFHAPEKIEEG